MKVIDLLNKIAKSGEIPNKIKYNNEIFVFDDEDYVPDRVHIGGETISDHLDLTLLNDEVEIIEEDKKIKNLKMSYDDEKEENNE